MSKYVLRPGTPIEVRQVTDDESLQEVADWIDLSPLRDRDSEYRRILLNNWAADSGDNFWVWENGTVMSDRQFQETHMEG